MQEAFRVVHADMAHQAGWTGKGVGVAVLDTGIFPHKDFDTRLVRFQDMLQLKTNPYDDCGHGTHIAGIIAGSGRLSMGRYIGIAPGASIISIKVLDEKGDGNISHLLMGLQWILQNRRRYRIRVVNISVGTKMKNETGENSVLVRNVERLWDAGLVVVVAAGNNGPSEGSVTTPGISRKVITVGASDDERNIQLRGGRVRNYSGRGPTSTCIVKPELVAPGSGIVSCNVSINPRTSPYIVKSGTSMATPIVSGAAALLLEKYPQMSNVDVKLALRESCQKTGAPQSKEGWGMLHIGRLLSL